MELALTIIKSAIFIIFLCFVISRIWELKSKKSMPIQVTKIVLAAILFALEIPKLVLEVSLGKEYVITILFLVLWALHVFLSAFLIRKKIAEENFTVSVVTKISECISQNEDDAEK